MVKTMTMTAGEMDYDSTFRVDPSGQRESDNDVHFLFLSQLLWILFIIIMPILFANMLVS